MRVFGRFLYALIAVGFFLLAFSYSRDMMQTRYLEDVFGSSLTDEDFEYPKYYYFYTSIPNYHKSEPIIEVIESGYEVIGYEVLRTNINNDGLLETDENIYLIVYSDYQDLSLISHIVIKNSITEETTKISLQRFRTLNIINGINDRNTIYLSKDLFLSTTFDKILLVDKNNSTIFESDFNINEDDFTINDFIDDFYVDYERLPSVEDLQEIANNYIFPQKVHIADDYVHIFWIGMAIYFTVLIFMTYIIFFRKKKRFF